jgi:hypothetical protein
MNPAIPIDEECEQPGRTQNRTIQEFSNGHTPVSLPDKDALLLILRLKRIHAERQTLPERDIEKDSYRLAVNEWSGHHENS